MQQTRSKRSGKTDLDLATVHGVRILAKCVLRQNEFLRIEKLSMFGETIPIILITFWHLLENFSSSLCGLVNFTSQPCNF